MALIDIPAFRNRIVAVLGLGKSGRIAAEALQESGARVAGVLAIFQYGFPKTSAEFGEKHIEFQTLTNYDTLIRQALDSGYIDSSDLDTLRLWRENPEGWGALYAL